MTSITEYDYPGMQPQLQLRTHQFHGFEPGPRLIITGAVHGNETCGTTAIQNIIQELDSGAMVVKKGSVTFIPITNPLAYAKKTRAGDRNLNRNLRPRAQARDFEDQLANVLCPLLAAHDVLLDLHSFQGQGEPFALMGPENNQHTLEPFVYATEEQRMVAHLGPRRIVEGWMQVYHLGTSRRKAKNPQAAQNLIDATYGIGTTEYMRSQGGYAITVECGQHADPEAPARGVQAIKQTLALLGMVTTPLAPPRTDHEVLRLVDVIDRESDEDQFSREWKSFDSVKKDEVIGIRANGTEVKAPNDGYVVFPNNKAKVHHEWFYFAQFSERQLTY